MAIKKPGLVESKPGCQRLDLAVFMPERFNSFRSARKQRQIGAVRGPV
jgi:hypothetical protein